MYTFSQNPSIHSGDRVQTRHSPTIWAPVTLKMGSRSQKSNQFLSLSQQYSCTSLVKIHLFIQEIGYRKAIFQQSEPFCDFEIGVIDWLIVLGFNDTSTLVGHFVSSLEKGRKEIEEIVEETWKKEEQEWKWRNRRNKNIPPLPLLATRIVGFTLL